MKCPHCDRLWKPADFDSTGMLPESVLRDHVQRFCPGSPPERAIVHVRRRA